MPVETIIDQVAMDAEQTLAESGFYWRERSGVKVLVCRPLEDAGFVNGFSTRIGGVSPFPENSLNLAGYDEDTAENIEENRRRFLTAFDGDFNLATAWQVHGDGVKIIRDNQDAARSDEKFDAIVAASAGILAGVKTADCVPILLCDPATRSYAAVHAGWRGTAQAITAKAIGVMIKEFGSDPGSILAAIGPAACGRNYEIGQDVIDVFDAAFAGSDKYFTPTRKGHALVDLHLANRDQLAKTGIKPENIFIAPLCTMERTDLFFSYRVEKKKYGKTGRLLSVVGRKA